LEQLLSGLRAVGEPTRLRLVALCAHGELSVSELTQILGQSQPRVSRHLKLLVEAGLLDRFREGAAVYYRLADRTDQSYLARTIVDLLPADDSELNRDLQRLDQVKRKRADLARTYFSENAARWSEIRALHVPETELEEEFVRVLGKEPVSDFLTVARTNLEAANLRNVHVRQGDMYNMPVEDQSVDLATLHLVLHYSDDPAQVIEEAARVLRPNGRLVIVDFQTHGEEQLRSEHRHHRLGFDDAEIKDWLEHCGLQANTPVGLQGDPLTVKIWPAIRQLSH